MDAALVQSDVAGWATQGEPPFAGHPLAGLRSISTLASDAIHIVVPRGSAIRSSKDLIGKRVSLGSEGSGSLAHARLLLAAWGLRETQIKARFLHESLAADALTKGELDAFIIVDGLPAPSVAELAKQMPIRLIPIDIAAGTTLRREDPLLHATRIPANTYDGVSEDITTLAVPVSLIVSTHMPDALVYGITKALWQPEAARLLAANQGYLAALPLAAAVGDLGVPLHDGARRYFQERGLFN
jgi:TRAP transporter TAXI family solute receptor